MTFFLGFRAIDFTIESAIGGMGFIGDIKLTENDGLFINNGDGVIGYIGNYYIGYVLVRNKKIKRGYVIVDVVDILEKELRRFINEFVTADIMYGYYNSYKKFDLHWCNETESLSTPAKGQTIKLKHRLLRRGSVVVTATDSSGNVKTFTENTDYTINYESGYLTNIDIDSATYGNISVKYDYYDSVYLEDLVYYLLYKYLDENGNRFVIDSFSKDTEQTDLYRVNKYNVNDYLFDALQKIAEVVGGKIWVFRNKFYFAVNDLFSPLNIKVEDKDGIFTESAIDMNRLVNDVHVYGGKNVVSNEDTFAGDGLTKTFYLSKIPDSITKVYVDLNGVWTAVPYWDSDTNSMKYNWHYDSDDNAIVFDEAPPAAGAAVVKAFVDYPDWTYAYEITIKNPDSDNDIWLVGKIVIDNNSQDDNVIRDFNWGAVRPDGGDIIFVTMYNNKYVEIPRKFFVWDYGNKAEIWFGGTMVDKDGNSTGVVFTIPAGGQVTVYMLFGNSSVCRQYSWSQIPITVLVDSSGKFSDTGKSYLSSSVSASYDDKTGIFTNLLHAIDNGSLSDSTYDLGIWKGSLGYVFGIYIEAYYGSQLPSGVYDVVIMASSSKVSGEVIVKLTTGEVSYYNCSSAVETTPAISVDGYSVWEKTLSDSDCNNVSVNVSLNKEYRKYVNNAEPTLGITFSWHVNTSPDVTSDVLVIMGGSNIGVDYWVIRPDGASQPCTYQITGVMVNENQNIRVVYNYEMPYYYNGRNDASIDSYGVRSVNIVVSYVERGDLLKLIGDSIIEGFSKPMHRVAFKVPFSYVLEKKLELGKIVTISSDLMNLSGQFIINSIKFNSSMFGLIEFIEIPDNYKFIAGMLGGLVMFDITNREKIRNLEVGGVSYTKQVGV